MLPSGSALQGWGGSAGTGLLRDIISDTTTTAAATDAAIAAASAASAASAATGGASLADMQISEGISHLLTKEALRYVDC